MSDKKKELRVDENLLGKHDTTSREEWKTKACPVVRYVPTYGILGFLFDGVPCQMVTDKNLDIFGTVNIKYMGSLKTGIKFKL